MRNVLADSLLSVCIGSTLTARKAGMRLARSAAPINYKETVLRVIGSNGPMP